MDKALLTRIKQEVENSMTLTKKLPEIYDFDSEYLTSNNTSKISSYSRNSAQSSKVLTCSFEYSSTSAFIAKQNDYEKIRPNDTWALEIY
ncbi:hypothetical protein Smp_180650 [Schistosoma mansoni]|uniref:hypothetical protein n=1 Tax=Schistosoma mansoni TaxID=6183 RepID=UPI00019B3803|nr:hypothetical protein Smp_180650 [Schistosoma mansoni]|eukprot:XP_018654011.1 hypothetical protein Smp_180650 [Schistosoma mansoni]